MPSSTRLSALALLVLHLQASLVFGAMSWAVLDDGRIVVEDAGDHVARWHAASTCAHASDVSRGPSCDRFEGLPPHRHLAGPGAVAPSHRADDIAAHAAPTPSGPPAAPTIAYAPFELGRCAVPSQARFDAAESAFGRVVLTV